MKIIQMKKHWNTIKIIIINWVIFALLLSGFAILMLMRDRTALLKRIEVCENNMNEFNKQVESGRIILELKENI